MSDLLREMAERRLAALEDKLGALAHDFAHWRAVSERGGVLEKHHTQVRRLVRRLDRLRAALAHELGALTTTHDDLVRAHDVEGLVLFVHNMWAFHRGKFAQRLVPWVKPFLDLADDYAWACLKPVLDAAVAANHVPSAGVREPPLTYLNSEWSPFAATRGSALMAEELVATPDERRRFREELQALPISVLGVPWYQLAHVPDLAILAHEVGHVVEDDLRLTPLLANVLAQALQAEGATPARIAAWRAWLGEAFADTFGTLAGGRAFALTMLDFVALDPEEIRAERADAPDRGDYPITALRADLMAAALRELGDADGAAIVAARRDALLDGADTMPDFRADASVVAHAWCTAPLEALGGRTLLEVARVPATHWATATRVARQALEGRALDSGDPRVIVSAARAAFEEEPASFRKPDIALDASTGDAQGRLLAKAAAARRQGTRTAEATGDGFADADDRAGAELVARLLRQT